MCSTKPVVSRAALGEMRRIRTRRLLSQSGSTQCAPSPQPRTYVLVRLRRILLPVGALVSTEISLPTLPPPEVLRQNPPKPFARMSQQPRNSQLPSAASSIARSIVSLPVVEAGTTNLIAKNQNREFEEVVSVSQDESPCTDGCSLQY